MKLADFGGILLGDKMSRPRTSAAISVYITSSVLWRDLVDLPNHLGTDLGQSGFDKEVQRVPIFLQSFFSLPRRRDFGRKVLGYVDVQRVNRSHEIFKLQDTTEASWSEL